jgi:hypothetical protein
VSQPIIPDDGVRQNRGGNAYSGVVPKKAALIHISHRNKKITVISHKGGDVVKRGFSFLALLCFSLLVLVVFCDSAIALGAPPGQEAGVTVITNPNSPKPPDGKRKRVLFKEELTIGVAEGDENYMFGDFIIFNTDDEGYFYVTDWDRKRIQKYSPRGKFLLTIGKQGQGPGEFGNISIARFDTQGRIYVTDIVNRKINFFDRAGNFLEQIPIPDVFENLYINSKGHYVSSHTRRVDSEYGFMAFKLEFGIFDSQFKIVSEFFSEVRDRKSPGGRDFTSRAKFIGGILTDMAFQARPYYVVADNDLVYFGIPEKYVIDVYSPEGKKIKSIRREYDPIEITEKDKDQFIGTVAEGFLRGDPEELRKEIYKFIKYPRYKPAYSSFALMENGWLAVVLESIQNEYTLFDLFDREGIYIGHFKADIASDFLFFKNGKAYAVATENDYKFAKRYGFEIIEESRK